MHADIILTYSKYCLALYLLGASTLKVASADKKLKIDIFYLNYLMRKLSEGLSEGIQRHRYTPSIKQRGRKRTTNYRQLF